jgi:hypothetical protein
MCLRAARSGHRHGDTYRGTAKIIQIYTKLMHDPPDSTRLTHVSVSHDDLACVEWLCKSARSEVRLGTGNLVFADALIACQTACFSIVAIR